MLKRARGAFMACCLAVLRSEMGAVRVSVPVWPHQDPSPTLHRELDARLTELVATRDLTRTWLHVDMDAFFAAVAERDQPELVRGWGWGCGVLLGAVSFHCVSPSTSRPVSGYRTIPPSTICTPYPPAQSLQRNKPFAVGGIGMISTANYVARRFGVRSAMPGFIALKLCPQLTFVKTDFQKYVAASQETRCGGGERGGGRCLGEKEGEAGRCPHAQACMPCGIRAPTVPTSPSNY